MSLGHARDRFRTSAAGHDGDCNAGLVSLDELHQRFRNACHKANADIEKRQKDITTHLKQVAKEVSELSVERRQLEDERASIEHQQADLDQKLSELGNLRTELGTGRAGWCCCARPEKTMELDVSRDHAVARVDAVVSIRVYGAGTEEVNGTYVKTSSQGDTFFRKEVDGKVLHFSGGAGFGLPDAWYIADCYRGAGIYYCKHTDDVTVPFAGWEVFDDEHFGNPGVHPPPLLEVVH